MTDPPSRFVSANGFSDSPKPDSYDAHHHRMLNTHDISSRRNSAVQSRSTTTLPNMHLRPSESPEEMDPSVLTYPRPGDSTESLPLSPYTPAADILTPRANQSSQTFPDRPDIICGSSLARHDLNGTVASSSSSGDSFTSRDRDCDSSLTDIQIVEESEDEVSSCDESQQLAQEPSETPTVHAPAPPTVMPAPPPEPATPAKRRLQRSDSVTTFHGGGSESIFRLLPRETRPALRRMLFVEPASRCTLTDLLKGRGKTSGLLCGCRVGAARYGPAPPAVQPLSDAAIVVEDGMPVGAFTEGHCVDHDDHDVADEDDGDEWLKSIESCSVPGVVPKHVHIKVQVDEKQGKRKFF